MTSTAAETILDQLVELIEDFRTGENANLDTLCGERTPGLFWAGPYRMETRAVPNPPYMDHSIGKVQREGHPPVKVQRNYPIFPFAFVLDHPLTGHDYLVCASDYQGLTVLDLTTGGRHDYLPKSAKHGMGWCHTSFRPSPDGLLLAAEGCFWGDGYYGKVYDFSRPTEMPWPVLFKTNGELLGKGVSWENDKTCIFSCTIEARKEDRKPFCELSEEELDQDPESINLDVAETFTQK